MTREKIQKVKVIRYAGRIVLYHRTKELLRYNLPGDAVKNERFSPEGVTTAYQPKNRKKPSHDEEKALRKMGSEIGEYIDFIRSKDCKLRQKHHFIRSLYSLAGKITVSLFKSAIIRSLKYRVYNIYTISRIAAQQMKQNGDFYLLHEPEFDDSYKNRDAYKGGLYCDEHELDNLDLFDGTEGAPE